MQYRIIIAGLTTAIIASSRTFAAAGENVSADGSQSQIIRQTWLKPRVIERAEASIDGGIAGAPSVIFFSTNDDPDGDAPDDLAYTPDGTQVLVVHRDTDNVNFIDVNTRTVTATVAVGDFPTDIAITPGGEYAIVPNVFTNDVSIIHIGTRMVVGTVPITGEQPYRVAVVPNTGGNLVAVGVINDAVNSSFSIINLNIQAEIGSFPSAPQGVIGFFFTPESGISGPLLTQFAVTNDGSTIVQPDRPGAEVEFYDRETGANTDTLAVAAGPTSIDISDDGTLAAIGHDSPGNAISKINLAGPSVAGSFTTPMLDGQVVRITPSNSHAIAGISNNVIFVNLTTGVIDTTIFTGVVGDIELSFDGQYAFVSNFNARVIHVPTRTLAATIPFAPCVEAATSPTQLRAVALNSRFREDIQFYNINGGSSSLEGFALTGAVPEGDAARDLAISADGEKVIVCHNTSRNIALIDLPTQTIEAYIDVGERPLGAAITPDGQYAVVCATDSNAVKIIDLSTNVIVKSLPISTRPVHVRISPDSQWAYVLNVAGTDQVSFIELNGADSMIVTQISMGLQAGSSLGYAYTELSGMELSADGSVLAVCDSFNDLLRLYDTATRTQIAAVPVGDFPIRAAFSPDATRAYVTNAFGDSVSIVDVNGGSSSVIDTVFGIEFPLTVNVDDTGSFAYIGNTDGNNPGVHVIDASSNTQVGFVSLSEPAREAHYSAADDVLYAALNDANLARIDAAGAASSLIDSTPLSAGPSDMVFSESLNQAIAAQPIPDGVDIVGFGPPCPADIEPREGDGTVNIDDLFAVIAAWGPCVYCSADIDGDGDVDIDDLFTVIAAWGPCR